MVLIGMGIALLAVELLLPQFNEITWLHLSLDLFGNWYTLPGLIVFALLVGLLAGSYPAFFLASFRPVPVLSGNITAGTSRGTLRRLLVILQFGISIFIILCTIVISKQLNFLVHEDLGFDGDRILVLERFSEVGRDHVEAFKQEIAWIPGVVSSSSSTLVPGHITNYNGFEMEGRLAGQIHLLHVNYIDPDFPETYGLRILNGRFQRDDFASDNEGIVINEMAVREFNIGEPLKCTFIAPSPDRDKRARLPVIGTMQDIHAEALQTKIRPCMMRMRPKNRGWIPYLSIRLEPGDHKAVMNRIESVWNQFTAEKRAREIGIRKAMGANPSGIVRLILQEIPLLTGIAALIAWPLAWYAGPDSHYHW